MMLSLNKNEVEKATKKTILNELCTIINLKKKETMDAYRLVLYLATVVRSHQNVIPWLTRNAMYIIGWGTTNNWFISDDERYLVMTLH